MELLEALEIMSEKLKTTVSCEVVPQICYGKVTSVKINYIAGGKVLLATGQTWWHDEELLVFDPIKNSNEMEILIERYASPKLIDLTPKKKEATRLNP